MKTLSLFTALALLATPAHALISGAEGNNPVQNHGWPAGSEHVANVESRIAHWEGPPFGGGQTTFEFREESTANFNKALELFAKVDWKEKELIIERGPKESFWLGIRAREDDTVDARMDWAFVVWNPDTWKRLYNDPESTFLSDHPNFRKPVEPPRIHVYLSEGGAIDWDDVKVPDSVTVIDKRGKPGEGPAVTGIVTDLRAGKPLAGAEVTLLPGQSNVAWKLPVATTGDDGRFELKGFPIGAYGVMVRKEGYASRRAPSYKEYLTGTLETEDLKLSRSTELTGTAHGPDGKPVVGGRVIAREVIGPDGLGYPIDGHHETETAADGSFRFTDLPHGQCRLNVWIDGLYQPGSVLTKYTLPREEPVEIRMIGTGTVEGTLVRTGKGQMNVSIEAPEGNVVGAWGGSTNCKPDGSFAFKNVPEGDYFVGPTKGVDLDRSDPSVKKITVTAGGTVTLELKD